MRTSVRDRHELLTNTIHAWTWSQGTLAVSVVALPLLTHFLSKDEFGLWTQLLSLSALATVADMGMSAVFLRRVTDTADASRASIMRAATGFYRWSSAILAAGLLVACLVPGGVLSPYQSDTRAPALAAVLVIAAMAVNLRCQTCTLRLLTQGRVDLERVFGAGPAAVGTLASILAAYWFGTAVAVALAYATVEVAFDAGLAFVARRYRPGPEGEPAAGRAFTWWKRLWHESAGVVVIDLVPMASVVTGVTVAGHVAGPAAAAVYGVAARAGSLVPRFFTPFTASLFVSLCRATAQGRAVTSRLPAQLSAVALAGGATAAFVVAAAGADGMRLVFGGGYGQAMWVVLVLALAETIRSMYTPFLRKIQSENGIGSLRYYFAASMVLQVPLAAVAAARWSAAGAAAAVLVCSAVFEAAPVALKLSAYHRKEGAGGVRVLRQAGGFACAGCLVMLLAWSRQRLGTLAIVIGAIGAVTTGLLALRQMVRYLAAARLVTRSSLAPDSGGRET